VGGPGGFREWGAAGGTPGLTEPDNGTAKPSPGTGASTGGGKRFSVWQAFSQISHTKPSAMFRQGLYLFTRELWVMRHPNWLVSEPSALTRLASEYVAIPAGHAVVRLRAPPAPWRLCPGAPAMPYLRVHQQMPCLASITFPDEWSSQAECFVSR